MSKISHFWPSVFIALMSVISLSVLAEQAPASMPEPKAGEPPQHELWLPRTLTREEKARRAASDALLAKAEYLRFGMHGPVGTLIVELGQRQYDLIEKQLDAILAKSIADPAYEFVEYDATAFANGGGAQGFEAADKSLVDAWVGARPDSPWAHYSAGMAWMSAGWKVLDESDEDATRGDQEASTDFTLAREELQKALALNPKLVNVWLALLSLDRNAKGLDQDKRDLEAALEQRPMSFLIPDQYEVTLEPSWKGSVFGMNDFAAAQLKRLSKNPRLWALQGTAAGDQGCVFCNHGDWETSLQEYNVALAYEDRPSWLEGAGDAAVGLHRYGLAYAFYQRAHHYKPGNFNYVIKSDIMDALCNPDTPPGKLEMLEREAPSYSDVHITEYPRVSGDCTYYRAELPWGDEPEAERGNVQPYALLMPKQD